MGEIYNVYCDESCHLQRDGHSIMVLGAVWCPLDLSRAVAARLREIKERDGLPSTFEIKWGKVSPGKVRFYEDVLDYFLDDDDLHFRALIATHKGELNHAAFGQDHDTWYYKMYFDLLKVILRPDSRYRIYLDIKDTRSAPKVRKLHDVLCHNAYDFKRDIIERIQTIRSHEAEHLQLADLLTGIVSYANRGLTTSRAKEALVRRLRRRTGYTLKQTTLLGEQKVNLFRWEPRETPL